MPIAIQDASNDIVARDASQHCYSFDQLARSLSAALASPAARQAHFRMHAAFPMQSKNELSMRAVHIDHDLLNQCAHYALLQPCAGGGIMPDRLQLVGQLVEVLAGNFWAMIDLCAVFLYACLYLAQVLQGQVPAALQFCGDEAVFRVRCVILPLRALCGIAGRFQIVLESFQNVIPLPGMFFLRSARKLR